jgi:cupin superfamily acireductone dioxygenase involved in methionine salvage
MKISENTEFKIDIKTVIGIIMLTTTLVGMYYTLQEDIQLAKTLPPVEVSRLEYELKEEWNEKMIIELKERVEMLEQVDDVIFEEIDIISTLIKDGTESDSKLDELNRQLEELKKRKPKTTVIVKEVEVSKKRKW